LIEGYVQKLSLSLLVLLVFTGCSSGPKPKALDRAFAVSSEEGVFAIRGRLYGSYAYDDKYFFLTVDGGKFVSTFDDQPEVHLQPLIAGPGPKDARRVAAGESKNIGDLKKLVVRELTQALYFTIPLPRDFDPDEQWLTFHFIQKDGRFSVSCDVHNLREASSAASARRLGWVCWANPE
jgi:hypothetical protein